MPTKTVHAFVIFFFVLLAIFLTLGRVGTAYDSFALLTPDLGVYASFAAAQDEPALFSNDPFLSNEKNINSYNMILVPVIKALKSVFGNYGTACAFLLPFFLFIHLAGWYLLGIALFRNPWAGLLVSLLVSTPALTYYDYWGLILDALPRFLYQGLIPVLLALSIRHGHKLRWWPVILAGIGLLNYVHPLSTPSWGIAVMLGLWSSAPGERFWPKARVMGLSVIILLLVLSPFVFNYVRSTIVETSDAVGYEQTLAILQERFPTMDSPDPFSALVNFFAGRRALGLDLIWYAVWVLGIIGLAAGLFWRKDSQEHAHLRQIVSWTAGILLIGGLVPVLERIVFTYLQRLPPEFEILKTLRYLVPLVLLAAVYGLWISARYLQSKEVVSPNVARALFWVTGIVLLFAWGLSSQLRYPDFRAAIRQNLSCWREGSLVCPLPPASMDFIEVLDVIRTTTPIGARIFSEGQEVAVRYYALRPLVFTYKDGAPLAYTDQEQLLTWSKHSKTMEELAFIRKFPFRHRAFVRGIVELAAETDADYILLQEPYDADLDYPEQLRPIYSNANYSLYELNR